MKGGRRLIMQLQKLMGRYSLVGDHNFFPPEQFRWVAELEANTSVIGNELDTVLARQDYVPNHQDISPDDDVRHWEEGKSLLFDDTFPHEARNDSDQTRVLFMDVLQPSPFPISLLNSLVIKSLAASPFIRDSKTNHEDWERRMSEIWN